jgi:hypothetical protein
MDDYPGVLLPIQVHVYDLAIDDPSKGEKYAENHVCTASLFRSHLEGEPLKANLMLYSSDLDHAPERVEHPGRFS